MSSFFFFAVLCEGQFFVIFLLTIHLLALFDLLFATVGELFGQLFGSFLITVPLSTFG